MESREILESIDEAIHSDIATDQEVLDYIERLLKKREGKI